MASSSIYLRDDDSTMSEVDDEVQELVSNCGIPESKGVPRDLWTTKWVFLHNDNGIVVVEGICHRIKLDLVIGSNGPLRDTHVIIQILKSLNADEFLNNWRYSIRACPIIHVFNNGASLFNHERRHKFNACWRNHLLQTQNKR